MGTLYVVPTPIGNLEDITLRALRLLREASLIAAEDTRTTRHLLTHYEINTPLISYHEHNKLSRLDAVLSALTLGDVALVSDAGTPGLSDPGYELIRAALGAGFTVCPLPGPSALLPALVASGLPAEGFLYLGFLPRRATERRAALEAIRVLPFTLVFYEAPHRLPETLDDLYTVLGDRPAVAAREITKVYEEFVRGSVRELILHFNLHAPRGEFVLLVGGFEPPEAARWNEEHVRAALAERLAAGEPRSAAAKAVATESGWERREVYRLDAD